MDARGYVNSPARCDAPQTAVLVGRTPLSLIAVCKDKAWALRVPRLAPAGRRASEAARGAECQRIVSGAQREESRTRSPNDKLLLTTGMRVVRDEAMLDFKDFREPVEAPVAKTFG